MLKEHEEKDPNRSKDKRVFKPRVIGRFKLRDNNKPKDDGDDEN